MPPSFAHAPPVPENKVYFPALDGFRAIALAGVFLDHYTGIPLLGLGVNAFFVLSGFLITGILVDTTARPDRVRTFYIRRCLRIFPLYYGIFLALLLATPFLHVRWNSAWILWPLYLGNLLPFLPPWLPAGLWKLAAYGQLVLGNDHRLFLGHLWSLCVEEQFYLLWPFLVFHSSRRFLFRLCIAVVILLPIARVLAAGVLSPALFQGNILLRTLPFQLDSLLLGGLLALIYRGAHRHTMLRLGARLYPPAILVILFFTLVYYRLEHPLFAQPWAVPLPFLTWQISIVNVLSAILLLASLQPSTLLARAFSTPALRWIGRISYGAYIFHDIPHTLYLSAARHFPPAHQLLLSNAFALAGTLLLATLSFYLFERPFLALKRHWS